MKITSFEEFKELARRGTFVPVCKEIVADLLTPVSAFLKIAEDADYAFLLESVEGGEHVGRYSFLGKDPFLILRARDGRTTLERGGAVTETRAAVHRDAARPDGRLPVAVCARSAAVHRRRGRLSRLRRRLVVRAGARRPRRSVGRRRSGRLHAVRHGARVRSRPAPHPDHRQRADHRATTTSSRSISLPAPRSNSSSASSNATCRSPASPTQPPALDVRSNRTREQYEEQVRNGKEHIAAGDIYQVVLSQRFEADVAADPFTVYRALRHVNPSPYMYLHPDGPGRGRRIVAGDAGPRRRVRASRPIRSPARVRAAAPTKKTCGSPRS